MKFSNAVVLIACLSGLFIGASAFAPSLQRSRSISTKIRASPAPESSEEDSLNFGLNQDTSDVSRRGLLSLLGAGVLLPKEAASSSVATTKVVPLADVPLRRLRLPRGGVGRDYIIIQLMIQGQGPYDFMIDSGLTVEMITPHLQQTLGIGGRGGKGPTVQGLAAGGSTGSEQLVPLKGAAVCCGEFGNAKELPLPPLYAVVTNFPQEHIDPQHDPVEGMLGMEMLDMFDADFDFEAGRFRLWEPGTGAQVAAKAGLVEIPSAVLNESGLLGIRVESLYQQKQPVIGIIDCGASFSALNLKAAAIMGLPTDPSAYRNEPSVATLGIDGRPQQMPTTRVPFTYAGGSTRNADGSLTFEAPPKNWKPWDPVRVGIADLPIFSQLLGDGRTPYNGPAALIGVDVLSQRRFILETGKGRARRIFMAPS